MTLKHNLNIDIVETTCSHVIKVSDVSTYIDLIQIACFRLEVFIPNVSNSIYIAEDLLSKGFVLPITKKELGLQQVDSEEVLPLSDGFYLFRYSVSPNEETMIEKRHYRLTKFNNLLNKERCKLIGVCNDADKKAKWDELKEAEMYGLSAKILVEECNGSIIEANKLYQCGLAKIKNC